MESTFMTKIEKIIQQLLNRPTSLRYKEIEKALKYLGFKINMAKGSHKKIKHKSLPHDLIIPVHNNDCKDFYKLLNEIADLLAITGAGFFQVRAYLKCFPPDTSLSKMTHPWIPTSMP